MALSFNGSTQYLATSTTPIADGAGNVTLACWFNSSSATANQALIAIDNLAGEGRYILSVEGATAGDPIVANYGSGTLIRAAKTSIGYSVNTWTHACATFSGASSRSAFINGGSNVTNNDMGSFVSAPTRLTLGALNYTIEGTTAPLAGLLAEAAIWNAALTVAEIASLAAGFTADQIRPQSLQFYAPLVRDLQDLRGGRTITNVNGATVATHPRVIQ